MNRILILFIIALLFAMPCFAGESKNIQVAKSMIAAINDRDLDRLNGLIAPNVVRHSAATAGVTVTNLEEFKSFLRTDFAAVPDSVIKIDLIFGNSNFVAIRAVYTGTQTGQMGPFPASGKSVELPFIGILAFTDNMISKMWVEWDNVFMLKQLGHMSASPQN